MIARNEVIAVALLADDVSTMSNQGALFFRNFAVMAGLNNDLKARSACCGRFLRDFAHVDEDALRGVRVRLLAAIGDWDTAPPAQRLVKTVPGPNSSCCPAMRTSVQYARKGARMHSWKRSAP
jgi:hypothetical protein